ncbi:MAG: hypothetical protein OEM59_04195 [Rhodospirillales bacterium]|nr:hypothetical protein [Rhodospirillales bacterium]
MEWAFGQLPQYRETAMAFLAFDTARLLAPGTIAALIVQEQGTGGLHDCP